MNLRGKILLLTTALMGILFLLAAGALIPELASSGIRRGTEQAHSSAQGIAATLALVPVEQRSKLLSSGASDSFKDLDLKNWAVCDENGRVVSWSQSTPPSIQNNPVTLRAQGYTVSCPVPSRRAGEPVWTVLVAPDVSSFSMSRELGGLAITMLIGALMLGGGVYMLVLRLVIHPMERLEQASRSATASRGLLVKVPHTDRMDEIGALMRSYNTMAGEVNDLRMNLEKKVRESVAALEKTQQNLILSERLSVTGKMAAGVAHEINNPLGGMLNAARSLHSKATPGTREADYLALILDGLGRIEHIVTTMKQFGRPTGEKNRVDVREVLEGSIVFIQHRAQEQNVTIKREIPEVSSDTYAIQGYRAALGQVFLNLMVNALDALDAASKNNPGREKKLTVKLSREGDWITVAISDTGIGMPKDVQDRAGEMFFTTKPETHGTGLGLAIVKHILQEHDGRLEIESKTGEGTTMRVKVPPVDTQTA